MFRLICNLCELLIEESDMAHSTAHHYYCDECWNHRKDEVNALEGENDEDHPS
jgi:hypothetical protein